MIFIDVYIEYTRCCIINIIPNNKIEYNNLLSNS